MTILLLLLAVSSCIGSPLEIDSFTQTHPWKERFFYLTLVPTEEAKSASSVFLKVVDHENNDQVWPNATINNFNASWEAELLKEPLRSQFHYTLMASTDAQTWGPPFAIKCCDTYIPPTQTTIVLSGYISESVVAKNEKIVISSSAVLAPKVSVSTEWEVIIENNATFECSTIWTDHNIESRLPVKLDGVSIRMTYEKNTPPYPSKIPIQLHRFLSINHPEGKFSEIFVDGTPPGCKFDKFEYGEVTIDAFFKDCPYTSLQPWDFVGTALTLCFCIYLLTLFVVYRKWKGRTPWRFMNVIFAVGLLFLIIAEVIVGLVLHGNMGRCDDDPLCPYEVNAETWQALRMWSPMGTIFFIHIWAIIWLQVAAFAFPRPYSKPSERFCARLSPKGRATVYFFSFSGLFVTCFLCTWVVTYLVSGGWFVPYYFVFLLAILIPAVIPMIFFCFCLCFPRGCISKCFGKYKKDDYDTVDEITL